MPSHGTARNENDRAHASLRRPSYIIAPCSMEVGVRGTTAGREFGFAGCIAPESTSRRRIRANERKPRDWRPQRTIGAAREANRAGDANRPSKRHERSDAAWPTPIGRPPRKGRREARFHAAALKKIERHLDEARTITRIHAPRVFKGTT
jgi:hypothetical protein